MPRFLYPAAVPLALAAVGALGASVPDGTWPESQGNVSYSDEPYTIKAGEVFDGGMKTYDRSDITCEGQDESGSSTAVFLVEAGGTLKNAIIGTNQMEGVHCDDSDCTIENVWWEDVCEDALSIKGGSADSVSYVTGGGARYADDKVVQHNGYGRVIIDGFYVQEFGKLYRSCGTCGDKQRFVNVSNVYAVDPGVSIVTVNENYGDEAKLSNIYISASDDDYVICGWSEGTDGDEPTELGDGPKDPLCQYSDSDIHINEAVPTSDSSASTASTTTTSTAASASAATTESSASATEEVTSTAASAIASTAASDETEASFDTDTDSAASSTTSSATTDASDATTEASFDTDAESMAASAASAYSESSTTSASSSTTETSSYASSTTSSTTTDSEPASTAASEADASTADEAADTTSTTSSASAATTTAAPTATTAATTTSKCSVRRSRA